MEENVLFENPMLKKIFTVSEFLYDLPLTISQVSFEKKTRVENHVLLLGDAAGMITPLCGNGMSMAMHGAKLAFTQMENYLQNRISRQVMEQNYMLHWRKQFAVRLATGRVVQRLMGDRFSTAVFLQLMNTIPLLSKMLIRATHGDSF